MHHGLVCYAWTTRRMAKAAERSAGSAQEAAAASLDSVRAQERAARTAQEVAELQRAAIRHQMAGTPTFEVTLQKHLAPTHSVDPTTWQYALRATPSDCWVHGLRVKSATFTTTRGAATTMHEWAEPVLLGANLPVQAPATQPLTFTIPPPSGGFMAFKGLDGVEPREVRFEVTFGWSGDLHAVTSSVVTEPPRTAEGVLISDEDAELLGNLYLRTQSESTDPAPHSDA